jgi:hypothetical protein
MYTFGVWQQASALPKKDEPKAVGKSAENAPGAVLKINLAAT